MKPEQARPVRTGEEFDVDSLQNWLSSRVPELSGPIEVSQFPSGHSNLTYLLDIGDHEVVLRRPPFGARVKSGHDMSREYRILSHLQPVWPKVPKAIAFCEDPSILGAPFYLMERVDGVILRGESSPPDASTMRRICDAFVETFAQIHRIDVIGAGLETLGRPDGYVERQVDGWSRRWHDAVIEPVSSIDRTIAWLARNRPPETGAALIHNDFKLDNLVLDPADLGHVRAVLDWEMATLGDPLMDLGSSLAYWAERGDPPGLTNIAGGPTTAPGSSNRVEIAERYAALTGADIDDLMFYYVFGLFRLAVIAQQIYYRYHHGFTSDERFAVFGAGARMLGDVAQQAIVSGEISRG
ncbi:putative aminoglycoside phosphotransferase [bacterium BMS3Abin02]|nr:putative aminoglycoside phosphotransferase [bacterium BMS3Abin02]